MELTKFAARHVHNANVERSSPYSDIEKSVVSLEGYRKAHDEISTWPGYGQTPLVPLPGLARELGLSSLFQKDEGKRFHLKSFKALGGSYAVLRLLQQVLRESLGIEDVTSSQLLAGKFRDKTASLTVATATDGNHGRSVAWGAQMFGCTSKVYLHSHVGKSREREIAGFGAEIVRVEGTYDDSVRQCAADAAANGWHLVADTTSGGGSNQLPQLVMQGYTIMVQEVLDQMPGSQPPTHVFVPGGVGGIAASVAGHLSETLGETRPRIIVIEPEKVNCIFRSIDIGKPTPVTGDLDTFMACLSAGVVSPVAWPVLRKRVDDVITVPDEAAAEAMRLLASAPDGDSPIVAGESGAAAMAGIIAACLDADLRQALELSQNSRVVAIGSEGATDADVYQNVVGRSERQVEAA